MPESPLAPSLSQTERSVRLRSPKTVLKAIACEELDGGDNFLQSGFWAVFRKRLGWEVKAFSLSLSGFREAPLDPDSGGSPAGERRAGLLVLYRSLPLQTGFAYIPHGPDTGTEELSSELLEDIGRQLGLKLPSSCLFIRFDLPFRTVGLEASDTLLKAPVDVQAPTTVIIDLRKSEDELLAEMKSKTRYNVRLAFRKGVEVIEAGTERLADWYALFRETALRDRIAIHPFNYYRELFDLSKDFTGKTLRLQLFLAEFGGELLGGIITGIYGRRATYLYGASSNRNRNLMAPYALQWSAMKQAKNLGAAQYDLFGISPSDDPKHPMYGLYRFKTGFGGRIIQRPGCWDRPLRPLRTGIFHLLERGRKFYFLKLRQRR